LDLEWTLQQEGFDYCYDKRLYDRLREGHVRPIRIERRKEGPESSLIALPPRKDPAAVARRQEIAQPLGLKPKLTDFKVYYGPSSRKEDEIDMKTRSMLEIMLEFAATVQVPEADVTDGKVSPGLVSSRPEEPLRGQPMRILVGAAAERRIRRRAVQQPVVLWTRIRSGEFRDPTSLAHEGLIDILQPLARK
jgi:hypothetical protein